MAADTGPSCIDTLTIEDSGGFTSADPQVDIRPSDETAPLMPVTVSSNCQRCLSQSCFLSDLYYPFLLAQGTMLILSLTYFWISLTPLLLQKITGNTSLTDAIQLKPGSESCMLFVSNKKFFQFVIAYNFFATLNCIIFTAIVVKSQIFVGFSIVGRNLIHLPKFWTLVILFALYLLGALLTAIISLIYFPKLSHLECSRKKCLGHLEIFGIAMDAIHSFFLTILIAFLNNVNIRNIGHIRTYESLKITLVVFCSCLAISWLTSVFGIVFSLGSKNDWLIAIGQILLLPFYQKAIELLWTKIFRDEKCIIGEISSQNDENRHSSAV